jgi:uncharacterized protein (TIGR03067 family)
MKPRCLLAIVPVAFLGADSPKNTAAMVLERFQGTWQLISAETNGKKAGEDFVKQVRVVIKGRKHSVYLGEKELAHEIWFDLDPTKAPKWVTDTLPDGRTIKGIYDLQGDRLMSCVAEAGKARPTEFTAKEGSGWTLRVFKRVKPS